MPSIACHKRRIQACATVLKSLLLYKFKTIAVLLICCSASAEGLPQFINISERNVSIEKIFNKITQQTGYTFIYTSSLVNHNQRVTLSVKNGVLKQVLDSCFKDQQVDYNILNRMVIVKERERIINITEPAAFMPLPIVADVKGSVKNEQGEPIAGATIAVKNTTIATQAGNNGEFTLSVPDEKKVLLISSIGYEETEYTITDTKNINIVLKVKATIGKEVVVAVSVGYGTLDKREVSSTITHVGSKELLNFAGNGVLNSLQGRVAGLSITNTAHADPNSSPNIQLRGVSSRSAGLGPLYVINGVPGGNVDNLNQNDIESIDVLKGGAASAIYGTRGSNGVILITTKKGSSQQQVFYDGNASFDFINNGIKVLSRDEFLQRNRGTDYRGNTNWLDAVAKDYAFQHKHTLQVSGGTARTNYIVSFDYRNAKGLDLRSSKKEYGARLNLTHTAANNLYSMAVTIAPRYLKSNNASYNAFSQSLVLNPTNPVMDTANPTKYNYINNGLAGAYNPVEELKTIQSGTEGKYLDWNASFRLNILKTLYTQVILGQQTSDFFGFGFTPSYNNGAINGNAGRNSGSRNYDKNDQKSFEWTGNYALDLKRHSIKLLAGYTYNYFNSSGMNANSQNFPSDVLAYNNLGTGVYNLPLPTNGSTGDFTFRGVGSYQNDSKLIAFFGRVNYDFDKKYFLSASLRREGSSKFGFDNKWGNFPAASVAWRISNEHFFPKSGWLTDLKLRADYGETGNQDFGNYLSLDTYSGYGFYSYNGVSYQVWGPSQNTNYDLRWEKAQNFNVGLDFELFQSRIIGSLNYYIRNNKDLLGSYNVPVPPNVQPTTFANVGSMKNSGLEIQLNATVLTGKNFNYTVSFAGATNENEFVSFSNEIYRGQKFADIVGLPAPGSPGTAQRLEEGKRIGSFFMLRSAGIDATGRLLVFNKDGKIIPGNQASAADKQYVGNGLPKFTASLGNNFTYKNFDAFIYFRGAFGYDLFNTTAFYAGTPVTQKGANVLATAYGNGKYAALTNAETYSSLSDYFLEKGDYVKLDNITLGYNFKSPVKYINSGRLYFTARNIYTFTKWTTGDPESVNVNGLQPGINGSLSYYPSTLQLIGGIQLKF